MIIKRKEGENMKTTEIPVYCWQCGKRFYIEISNVYAGHLFCSEKCRKEDYEKWLKAKEVK
jgi:endogenous inhibitor of DNA gyrase (YacG/DUF329 family)